MRRVGVPVPRCSKLATGTASDGARTTPPMMRLLVRPGLCSCSISLRHTFLYQTVAIPKDPDVLKTADSCKGLWTEEMLPISKRLKELNKNGIQLLYFVSPCFPLRSRKSAVSCRVAVVTHCCRRQVWACNWCHSTVSEGGTCVKTLQWVPSQVLHRSFTSKSNVMNQDEPNMSIFMSMFVTMLQFVNVVLHFSFQSVLMWRPPSV